MPRGKWIDKKTATHFTLVHRPQNDPLIHDESAPAMVLNPTQLPNQAKVKKLGDLASELGSDAQSIRDNEGEAAQYGVYFDDTEYDYMQHLRDLNSGVGGAVFVEANPVLNNGKGKQKESLEDALQQLDLQNKSNELFEEDMLPSKNLQKITYQAQQDVPDAIAGFQPDMDPRLREVLEALEDEAYVDDDEDIFQQLAENPRELSTYEFDDTYEELEEDEEGWESDDTAKPTKEYKQKAQGEEEAPQLVDTSGQPADGPSQDWMEDFKKFKKDQKTEARAAPALSEIQSSIWTTTTNGGLKKKKRKGALTNPSSYSMTSSSLVRTEQLGILDSRFEKIDEEYNADMDDMGSVSAASTVSVVQGPVRGDFDGMLDEFLGGYTTNGKIKGKWGGKYGGWNRGVQQLDDIRKELGPPKLRPGHK